MNVKIFDKLLSVSDKINEKNRLYIFIGILLSVGLLDYFILLKPQLATLTKIIPETRMLAQDIKKLTEDIQKLEFYRHEAKRFKKQVEETNTQVSSKEEVSLILERISLLANQSGLRINHIMPITSEQEILMEDNERQYFSLPILVKAAAGYHHFGRFLNQIEKDGGSLDVGAFAISSSSDPRQHAIELTLRAIVFEKNQ